MRCKKSRTLIFFLLLLLIILVSFGDKTAHRIEPDDFLYIGAFILPDNETGSYIKSWNYGGHSMTYYPYGDPDGPDDGYPGTIFATGHAWEHQISEIDIPVPVFSETKKLGDLNKAKTLQSFEDIIDVSDLEIPRTGLAYLPPRDLRELRSSIFVGVFTCRMGLLTSLMAGANWIFLILRYREDGIWLASHPIFRT